MPLPRFNSGRMGSLEWSHLNEAFDRIERPEATQQTRGNPYRIGTSFLVQSLGSTGTGTTAKTAFQEVALSTVDSGTFVPVVGGVKSSNGEAGTTGLYKTPIVGAALASGTVATVLSHIAADGSLYFVVGGAASSAFMAIVVNSVVIYANRSWTYEMLKDAEYNSATGVWTGTDTIYGYNGCENPIDAASIGVGTVVPTGGVYLRKPIKPQTVVSCLRINNKNYFSIPNGYGVTC